MIFFQQHKKLDMIPFIDMSIQAYILIDVVVVKPGIKISLLKFRIVYALILASMKANPIHSLIDIDKF